MTTNNATATATAYETALNAYTMANVTFQSAKTKETEANKVLSNVRAESASIQVKIDALYERIKDAESLVATAKTPAAKKTKATACDKLKIERAGLLAQLSEIATSIEQAELKANEALSLSAKAGNDKAEKAAKAAQLKLAMEDAEKAEVEKAEVERLRAQHEAEIAKLKESMELAKTQADRQETEKEDESEELVEDENSKGFIEQMKAGEDIAIALNKKFKEAFRAMKDKKGMRDLKNIVLALVMYDTTGKYATDLQQVKKYISTFSPFDVRISKKKGIDDKAIYQCRLIQTRDTDFWPISNAHYWDKIVSNKGKKAPTLEKVLKQVEDLELSEASNTDKFQFFMQVAKKLGFDSMVSYEAMETRLLALANKAA